MQNEQLNGHWMEWRDVARAHTKSEDLIHDIVIKLHDAYLEYGTQNGNLPPALMHKIAINYLRDNRRSNMRRRYNNVSPEQNIRTLNSSGKRTIMKCGDTITDNTFEARLESKEILSKYSRKLIQIADKIQGGETLTSTERQYLWRWRKQHDIHIRKDKTKGGEK